MKYYKTGELARQTGVSTRSIRFYDEIDLLKPSKILENGYRLYSEVELFKLQRIISLKTVGFSLEDIKIILVDKDNEKLKEQLEIQLNILDEKIEQMLQIKEVLKSILKDTNYKDDFLNLQDILEATKQQSNIVEHYKTSRNLNIRKYLHDTYRSNPIRWFDWIQSNLNLMGVNKILELGCGDGSLWRGYQQRLRNRELYLSDKSEGMLEEAKVLLNNNYNFFVMDAQNITFQPLFFDIVIANHVLFYLSDVDSGLKGIVDVLKPHGVLYASTYGISHMKELEALVKQFDSKIKLSPTKLYEDFGLENGEDLLSKYFDNIHRIEYEDTLHVDNAQDIYEYVISCNGNQNELLSERLNEFYLFIEEYLIKYKQLVIHKDVGLFIAHKK